MSSYLLFPLLVYKETPCTPTVNQSLVSILNCFHHAATTFIMLPFTSVCPNVQNALTLGVLSLIGCQFCHTCSLVLKARPFGLITSLVLDSMILRERHKISIRRLYWLCHLVIHSNCSMARLKTLTKTKQLDSNCSW